MAKGNSYIQEVNEEELKEMLGADSVEAIPAPARRQIVIETDGNNIRIVKAEVAGNIELVAILKAIVEQYSLVSSGR